MKFPKISLALSLKTKTRLTFGVLFICCAVLGGLAIRGLSVVSHQSMIMSSVWAPRSDTVDDLQAAVREYRISEALRILSVTPEMAEQADGDLEVYAEQFQGKLVAYRKLLKPGESPKQLNTVAELWATYQLGNEQMLAYSRENKTMEASDRFRNSASKFYLLTNALNELSDYNAQQSAAASATADLVYKRGRLQMIANLSVIAAVVFAAALFFELTVWRALVRLAGVMKRLARGDFEVDVPDAGRRDEVGEMARAVQVFKDNGLEVRRLESDAEVQRGQTEAERRAHEEMRAAAEAQRAFVVASIATGLSELSSGDLTFRLTEDFAPEFRKLQDDFNSAMDNLQETMRVISSAASGIHSGTEEISLASDKLARRTEKQAASLEEAAAALEHVTQTVRTSAESAKQAKKSVASAKANAEQSGLVVRNTVSAMSEIERSARQISEIIGVMDEIAFQTNLLALNAGIEAARAGEAGRGFAVVASEVRALAQRSTVAAKEIKVLISSSTQHVGSGVNLVAETGKALEQISVQVAEINGAVAEIAAVAEEQAAGLLQINSTVSAMDKGTQQNAAMSQEATAASHVLAQEANELARLIGKFQIGESEVQIDVEPSIAQPASQGRAILRAMSSGNAAMAAKLETAISEDSWEEF